MTDTAIAMPQTCFASAPVRKVGVLARINGHLFGSPDFNKAQGGYRKAVAKKRMTSCAGSTKKQIPVYQIDAKHRHHRTSLPQIWLSEKVYGGEGSAAQTRAFTTYYPNSADRGGVKAMQLAERYFAEGINVRSGSEELRIQCFQAAELLYMHAMKRGNILACTRLGVIYRFDMCRGRYLKDALFKTGKHAKGLTLQETAFKLFRKAAVRGEIEAMVQVGEMLREGCGCEQNEAVAFKFFKKALKRSAGVAFDEVETWVLDSEHRRAMCALLNSDIENAANIGNAALHVAESFEEGSGARQSFEMAKIWYEVAYEALSVSFGCGFWYSKRNKDKARWGYRRALQEMNGKY